MSKRNAKTILIIIPTGEYAERRKLEGVVSYAKEKNGSRWNLRLEIGGTVGKTIRQKKFDPYDGIIAYIQSASERKALLSAKLPTVLIEDLDMPKKPSCRDNVASIVVDHIAEGRTAASYFLKRNYKNFAFVSTEQKTAWSDLREKGFLQEVKHSGHAVHTFHAAGDLVQWLSGLPRPCALFAARDRRARLVLDAAEEAGISVPHELAILGIDDDEILCTTTSPTLSSIPTFDYSLGYAAGRALNLIMSGRSHGGVISTRHSHVVTRRSTDMDALSDPFVASALEWARRHLNERTDAYALAKGIGYSKRALQSRTERALGISISEAVKRIKLEAAKDLLANTDFPIADVAEQCGFASTSHLSMRLKASTGHTPLAYRRNLRTFLVDAR